MGQYIAPQSGIEVTLGVDDEDVAGPRQGDRLLNGQVVRRRGVDGEGRSNQTGSRVEWFDGRIDRPTRPSASWMVAAPRRRSWSNTVEASPNSWQVLAGVIVLDCRCRPVSEACGSRAGIGLEPEWFRRGLRR